MKFNNFFKLYLLICFIGVSIAASSPSSDDRKNGKGRKSGSRSTSSASRARSSSPAASGRSQSRGDRQQQPQSTKEEDVDKDQQLVVLKKIYIRYLLNPDAQLLVDANLISSLYHIKITATMILNEYNGLADESKIFLLHFAEYMDLYKYIFRHEYNNEERYCALFKLVYWTLRKDNVLSKSSAWRAHMREVLDRQLMTREPPIQLDWEKECTEHDKRAIRDHLHKDGGGEVMNEYVLRVLMQYSEHFRAFMENYESKTRLKQRLRKLMGNVITDGFAKDYETVFSEVENNGDIERLMLRYTDIILSKSLYSVKDLANTDQAAAIIHYNRHACWLITNFKNDNADQKFDKRINELKIQYSELRENKQWRTNRVLCVMYKFYRQIVDDPVLLRNTKWRTHLEADIRRHTSQWIKHPNLIKMESKFTDETMNFSTLECSGDENEKVMKMVSQSPYREQIHFWCLQWLIKNSAEFKQLLDDYTAREDLDRMKTHLFTLLGAQELDRLELMNADTLKIYEPDFNFMINMYISYMKTDKLSANIIELRLSISFLMTKIVAFGRRINQRILMSKENEQRYKHVFDNLSLYKRKTEAALALIVELPDSAEDMLKGIACSMMKFNAICPNIDDVDAIAAQFMKKSVNEWLKCSATELGETMSKQNDLMKAKHRSQLSKSIENDKSLREEIRQGKFAIYRMSKLVGSWNMQTVYSMTTSEYIKDSNYFKNINEWISAIYANFLTGENKKEKSDSLRHKILLNMFSTVNYIESIKIPSNFADVVRCQMLIQIGKVLLASSGELSTIQEELLLKVGGLLKHIEKGLPGGKQRDLEKTYHDWKNILQSALEQKDKQKELKMMPNKVQYQHSVILQKLSQNKQRDTDSTAFNFLKFFKGLFENKYGRDRLVELIDVAFIRNIYEGLNLQFKESVFPKTKQMGFSLEELEKEEKSIKKSKSKKKKSKNLSKIDEEEKSVEQKSKGRSGSRPRSRSSSKGAERRKSVDKKKSSSRGSERKRSRSADKKSTGRRERKRSKSAGVDREKKDSRSERRKSTDSRVSRGRESRKSTDKDKEKKGSGARRRSKSAGGDKRTSSLRGRDGRKSMDVDRKKSGSAGKGSGSSEEKRKRSGSLKRESRDLGKRVRSKSQGDRRGKSHGIPSPSKVADLSGPSQFRHNINLLFNMPSTRVRSELCDKYGYRNVSNKTRYSSDFTFATEEYGPGEVVDIRGDGNCGYRSLSYILTGTEDNHVKIRKDILNYLEKALFANKDWCGVYGLEGLEKHIKVAKDPSRGPDENEKWMSNIDILAAAKLYNMNIIVCEPNQGTYRWHIHSPNLTGNFDGSEQDVHKPSVFIYHSPAHFEVIKSPQKMRRERGKSSTRRSGRGERADSKERRKSSGSRRLTKSSGRKERPSKREKSGDKKGETRSSKDRQRDPSRGRKSSGQESSSKREPSSERKRTPSSSKKESSSERKRTPSSSKREPSSERKEGGKSSKDIRKDDSQRRKPSRGGVVKSGGRRLSKERKDKSDSRKKSRARSSSRDSKRNRRRSSSSKSSGRRASGHSMYVERKENAAKIGKLIIEEIGKSNLKACRSKKALFEYYGKFVGNLNEIVQQMCDFCVYINQIEKQIKQAEIILRKLRNSLWKIDQKRLDSLKSRWNEIVGRNFGPIGANPQIELKEKLHGILKELNEILFGRKGRPAESVAVEIADILGQLHFNKFSHFLSLDKAAKSGWDSKSEQIRQLALFNLIQSIDDWKASEKTLKSYKKRMDRFNERIGSWKKFSEQAALDAQLRAQYNVKKEDFVAKKAHNWQQIQFGNEEKTTDSKLTTQLQDEIKFVDIFGEERGGRREIIIFKNAYKNVKDIVVDWNKEAELVEYGSYMVGALTVSSDVDAICVLPQGAKLDSFFGKSICNIVETVDKRRRPVRTRTCDDHHSLYCKFCKDDNIIQVKKIPGARIPIIKLEYCADKDVHKIPLEKCQDRVDFDLQFAAVPFAAKSNGNSKYDIYGHIRELKKAKFLEDEQHVTLRSLEGLKQNELILEILPKNARNLRLSISAIKHWAKRYHIYSPIYGYLKGIGLTIMMAKIFALFPTATVPFLLEMFFFTFITWPWQMPVQLLPVANSTPSGPKWELEAKSLRANWYSRFGLPTNIVMPIVAPDPEDDVSSNMTESAKEIVMESMQEGLRRIREVHESGHWGRFLDGIDIGRNYQYFLVINCATRGNDEEIAEDFCEYVNSKLRMQMTLDVVNNRLNSSNIRTAHIFTTKKAQNHRCVIPGENYSHFQGYFCKLWVVGLKYFDNAPMSALAFGRFENKLAHEDQLLFKSYAGILARKSQAKYKWFMDQQRDYFVHTRYLTSNQLREWGITLHGSRIDIS